VDRPVSLVALRCRTSDRTPNAVAGVDALAPLVAKRLGREPRSIGSPEEPRRQTWEQDLASSRGCLLEAGGQVDDALDAGSVPVVLAPECSVALTTVPTALRHRPEAKVLWLDAHGDFNTPDTTPSGYLGGMGLAAACGLWDAGLGVDPVDPEQVVLAGVRDLDDAERAALERNAVTLIGASTVETLVAVSNALERSPVFVHLDLDVLDPDLFPAQFPAADGLTPGRLLDVLEAVAGECELVGLEVASFEAPEDPDERAAAADVALDVLEPLLHAISEEAHVHG
jgi:arginase family enzyme